MARQVVDIGVEGNDGTGDSIRESFRKTNENFRELYAVFGQASPSYATECGTYEQFLQLETCEWPMFRHLVATS